MQPILLDLPLPIKTNRLIIRPLMPDDGKILFKAIDESRAHLCQWLDWVENVKTWHDSELTARQFYANFILRKSLNFTIIYNGTLIGGCSLHNIEWSASSAEVGYWCHANFQKQGFITEAVQALIDYNQQYLHLQQLVVLSKQHNLVSIKIAEKLGFKLKKSASNISTMKQYVRCIKLKC